MTPDQARSMYRRQIGQFETVTIRIYTGTGPARAPTNYDNIRARPVNFDPDELVGPIVQGDCDLIVLAEDVEAAGITLATGANYKVVIRSKELQIKAIDDKTRRIGGVLCAYDIVAGG